MSKLKFSDGVEVEIGGKYRIVKLADGWYVVGQGYIEPASDYKEAVVILNELKESEKEK